MGNLNGLIVKIVLGMLVATNFIACIITTDLKVLLILNLFVAVVCLGIVLFIGVNISRLARDLGISKGDAGKLVGEYFTYYKNVERIPIDEYLKKAGSRL
jgi:hypothetical protein